jgi:hypothetical protein
MQVIDQANLAQRLDEFRRGCPGCETVVLVDLSSQMVLCANSDHILAQEVFDALIAKAAGLFTGTLATSEVFDDRAKSGEGISQIISMNEDTDKIHVFLRSSADPVDALCCICVAGIDLVPFIKSASDALARIWIEAAQLV